MKTTSPSDETGAEARPMPRFLPDHYSMLGVDFSLSTDSIEVRDFFRAAYRRFRREEGNAPLRGELELKALIGSDGTESWAGAGSGKVDLSGRAMPENRAFLFLLNALMDQVEGFLLIHGAAFSVRGRGFVVAGPPTAGKSTLALELARHGAVLLSDDVAPMERSSGLLHAFPRAIGIRRDAGAVSGVDAGSLPAHLVHGLPHKWLVDPEALGIPLPGPGDAPCPVEAVFLLDPDGTEADGSGANEGPARRTGVREMEIALAEPDPSVLAELSRVQGVSDPRPVEGSPFPLYAFKADRAARPMEALAALCRDRRDVILFLDEARPLAPHRDTEPRLREARWSTLLVDLTRELLNRSETGKLMKSCGNLPALMSEMGRVFHGARGWLLRPGTPERTAQAVLDLVNGLREADPSMTETKREKRIRR